MNRVASLKFVMIGALLGVFITSLIAFSLIRKASQTASMTEMSSSAAMDMQHSHPPRPVNLDLPLPELELQILPDAMDGYNLQLLPKNFAFTPARINQPVRDNEGHAHLYINGQKVARLYGYWFHLPSQLLITGTNHISVTLNANDHSEWTLNDVAIAATVRVVKIEQNQ